MEKVDAIEKDNIVYSTEKDGNEFVNIFNNYFINIATTIVNKEFENAPIAPPDVSWNLREFNFREITYNDILMAIKKMATKKSVGVDGISIITVKNNLDVFIPLLSYIYNLSINTGTYPDIFKTALVIPVHKSGPKTIMDNYRPISLLPTIAKIFEKCVYEQFITFLFEVDFFSDNQYGFLPKRGIDLALISHINNIVSEVDQSKSCIGLYIDFKKAFDLIDLNILNMKLEACGFRGRAHQWLTTFLFKRKQAVRIKKTTSKYEEIKYGVPQGGVLGPLLFLIFINDLLQIKFNSSVYAYADDTSLVCSANNYDVLNLRINADLKKLSDWLNKNKLVLNISKTKFVNFSYRPEATNKYKDKLNLQCHKFKCHDTCVCDKIESTDTIKYLGLLIDSDLRWRSHIEYLCNKLRKINYNLYYIKQYISKENMLHLYYSWYQAPLIYGIIHWGGTYRSIIKPIINSQRWAIRTIADKRKFDSITYYFKEIEILNVQELYMYTILQFLRKNINIFPTAEVKRSLKSNATLNIATPSYMKETSRRQAYYAATNIFNKNKDIISNNYNKKNFKQIIKSKLLLGEINII